MLPLSPALATTTGGLLLVLSIAVPVAGVLLAFALGDHYCRLVVFAVMPFGLATSAAILTLLPPDGDHLVYLLGAWSPPLGVALRADGLSAVMLATTAVVVCAIAIFAATDFGPDKARGRAPFAFWILLLAIWGALNTIFVGGDLFTLYVALELLTFAAVPLVSLDGRAETLGAALRYLLFALLGSVLYLSGTVLLYGLHGTLDIVLLSRHVDGATGVLIATSLMTVGLLAKTAVFPLHLWLPPAHAGAPAPASAILSGLVVKGSFFIILRLWFNVMPAVPGFAARQLLAALGTGAVVFGSVVALRQERLKPLIAYSTVAQIGYLCLIFPLALGASDRPEGDHALAGGVLQAISHATAKAAMFLAAGSIYIGLGHDRIIGLRGVARALPLSFLTFALGGIALIGLPPSGTSLAKELLLQEAMRTGQWWWAVVLYAGGMLTAAYVVLVLAHVLAPSDQQITLVRRMPQSRDLAALALALSSLLLGLVPWEPYLSIPYSAVLKLIGPDALFKSLLATIGGAALAIVLSPWPGQLAGSAVWKALMRALGPFRRTCLAFGGVVERGDDVLCHWPAACVCVLALTLLLAASMIAAN
jgi:multicomponent Na+:H+ antiporter subunit D